MRPLYSLISVPILLTGVVHANSFSCNHIRAQGKSFNLEKLGGPHFTTSYDDNHKPKLYNYTWTVDICAPLKKVKEVNPAEQCPMGTNVCGIQRTSLEGDKDPKHDLAVAIPVAGSLAKIGSALEPFFTLLNKTDDHPGGLRMKLKGGEFDMQKQRAIIEFLCDQDATGNERRGIVNTKADDEDKKETKSLTFKSYEDEEDEDDGKVKVLRMDWKTKYVCEKYEEDDDEDSPKSSWGFFTWFILLLFMGVSAYLIFGSWLNYNRYGARGWDLLPHGDTIRDVPYIFKDFSRKVLDTFSGGGSRGGYSAV